MTDLETAIGQARREFLIEVHKLELIDAGHRRDSYEYLASLMMFCGAIE